MLIHVSSDLNGNQLGGFVPDELAALRKLQSVYVIKLEKFKQKEEKEKKRKTKGDKQKGKEKKTKKKRRNEKLKKKHLHVEYRRKRQKGVFLECDSGTRFFEKKN